MEGYAAMSEKLDIKILILFILRRLPSVVDAQTLANLALGDGTVGYFDFAECLAELVDSGHVDQSRAGYLITEKGSRNCEIVESSLPYTIRRKLEKTLRPLADRMRRRSMIVAEHAAGEDGGMRVRLALDDDEGTIMDARFLCGGEEQAARIEEKFREQAEQIYNRIMEMLLEEE